jgi:hypothetical protein
MAPESKSKKGKLKDSDDVKTISQAEGERGNSTSSKVKPTPSQAEGDRKTVEDDIKDKERKGKL